MIDRLKTIVIVAAVTCLIWLYAEAESLSSVQEDARVTISAGPTGNVGGQEWQVRPVAEDWPGVVKMTFEGPSSALPRAPRVFTIAPGAPGFPQTPGEHTVDLRTALRGDPQLAQSGLTLTDVEPPSVKVRVASMGRQADVPVLAEAPGVQLAAPATVEPARVMVVASKATLERLRTRDGGAAVIARPSATALGQVREGVRQRLQAVLSLPPEIDDPDATIIPREATVTLTARAATEQVTLDSAQVQVLLPPADAARHRVDLPDQPSVPGVTVVGPREVIERVRSGELRIVAVVALSADDLAKRVEMKRVSFVLMAGDTPAPMPAGVAITAEQTAVRVQIRPVLAPIPMPR